tara:strand:- start:15332 stop:17482 length:2151 start_codon:yes stop_codon:yes gene_type:complete
MTWEILLKAGIGNVTNRFFRDDVPDKKEIDALTDAETSFNTLDTTLQDIKDQYNSSKNDEDIPEKIVTRMVASRRGMVGEDRKDSLRIVGERIKAWEKVREMFSIQNPLHDKVVLGIKYSDLESPTNKTDKEWSIEIIKKLYEEISNQDITTPLDNITNMRYLFALHEFLNILTNGEFKGQDTWKGKVGLTIETNKNFIIKLKKLLLHPDNTGQVEKISRYFGLNLYNVAEKKPEESKVTRRGKFGGEDVTRERSGIADPRNINILPEHTPTFIPVKNLNTKLTKLSLFKFRLLVNKLNQYNVGEGLIPSLQDKTIDIIHDTIIRPTGIVKIDELVESVDLGRKGLRDTSRRRLLSKWGRDYLSGRGYDSDIETFNTMSYPSGGFKNKNERKKYLQSLDRNQGAERKQLDRFIAKVNNQENPEYDNWIRWNEEGSVRGSLASTIKTDISLDALLETFTPPPKSKYRKNIIGILMVSFMEANNINEYRDTINDLITSEEDFVQYIPSGKLFADTTETSFISSMQAILTFIIRVFGEDSLSTYNTNMASLREEFWSNTRQELVSIAEEYDMDYPDDKSEIISEFIIDGEYSDANKTSIFGVRDTLTNVRNDLQELLLDLKTSFITELFNVINKVGDNKESLGKLKNWLLKEKYLTVNMAPAYFNIGDKKYKLTSSPSISRTGQEFEYVLVTTNKKGKEKLTGESIKLTIDELLGDVDE